MRSPIGRGVIRPDGGAPASGSAADGGRGAQLAPARRVGPRPLVSRLTADTRVSAVELLALAVLLVAFLATALQLITLPTPLGHDESVYGVQARAWLFDAPAEGVVAPHRAPLLPALGIPAVALGGAESLLRFAGVAFGVVAAVGIWLLGRSVGSPVAGLLAAGVFVFAGPVLDATGLFLTDLPAAALLLCATALLWRELEERDAPSWWLLAVAPLAAGAFYLRYGSALVIALLAASVLVVWRPQVSAHRHRVAAAAGLFVLLLVPHLVNATLDLGSPWGRVLHTGVAAGREYLGHGLVEYIRWWPRELAGRLAGVVTAVGIGAGALAVVLALIRRRWSRRARGYVLLTVPGVAHIVLMGIAVHADPRFVFFALGLLVAAGCVAVADSVAWLGHRVGVATATAGVAAAALLIAVSAVSTAGSVLDQRERRADGVAVLVAASQRVQHESTGSCGVLTSYGPQVTWYSGCASVPFGSPPEPGRERHLDADERFLLLFEGGKRQPEGAVLDDYLRRVEPVADWRRPGASLPSAKLYRF